MLGCIDHDPDPGVEVEKVRDSRAQLELGDRLGRGDAQSAAGFSPRGCDHPLGLLAEDIHALVAELGFDSAIVVGHDIGMMVAYAYAAMYPDETRGVVMLDAPLPGIEPVWSEILVNPLSWHFDFHAEVDLATAVVAGQERDYLTAFYDKFGDLEAFSPQAIDEYVRAYSAPGALRGGFEWYRGFALDVADNAEFSQSKLAMPVLALGGELSSGPFMGIIAEAVAETPRSGSIAGSGHWITEEQPDALLQELSTFFAEIEAAGGQQ